MAKTEYMKYKYVYFLAKYFAREHDEKVKKL